MKHRYLGRASGACGKRALFLLVDVSFLSGKRFLWEPRWLPLVMSLILKFEDASFFTHTFNSPQKNHTPSPLPKRTQDNGSVRKEGGLVMLSVRKEGGSSSSSSTTFIGTLQSERLK